MTSLMEPTFQEALRETLVRRADGARARLRRRLLAIGGGAALAVAIPAGALAYQYLQPGVNEIDMGSPVSYTGHGTEQVDLGPRPAGVTQVYLQVTCLTDGRFAFDDGASVVCSAGEETTYAMPIQPGVTSTGITAHDSFGWRLIATYQQVVVEPFAVNANGHTYGSPNDVYGDPDLIAAYVTNGELGCISSSDLENAFGSQPTSPEQAADYTERKEGSVAFIPVYLADGEAQIGEFRAGWRGERLSTARVLGFRPGSWFERSSRALPEGDCRPTCRT